MGPANRGSAARALVAAAAVIASLFAPPAAVAAPPGPRALHGTTAKVPDDDIVFDSNRTGNYEIFEVRTDGADLVQLTRDGAYDSWWPKISPDRTHILFYRVPAGTDPHDTNFTVTSLWEMNADGTDQHVLIPEGAYGWQEQGHVTWAPDGRSLAMFAGSTANPQIWTTTATGSDPRQLTDRGGVNIDPSWVPGGASILFVSCPQAGAGGVNPCVDNLYDIYRLVLRTGAVQRLTNDAYVDNDPYTSPDGRTIAFIRSPGDTVTWGLYRMNPDGSGVQPIIDNGGINSKPGWALDSRWIYFFGMPDPVPLGPNGPRVNWDIYRIRPDGSGLSAILPEANYDNEYPVNASD